MPTKKVRIELDYDVEDRVYLIHDPDQVYRQIIHVLLCPGGVAMYEVRPQTEEIFHYACELSLTKALEPE